MDTIINYLKQTSTYTGVFTILGLFGVTCSNDLISAISTLFIAIVGVVEVVRNEKLSEK